MKILPFEGNSEAKDYHCRQKCPCYDSLACSLAVD